RNLADSMAYVAADPEEVATQDLRAAVPVPSREFLRGEDVRFYDTGRFRVEARLSQLTVYDKATGLEATLVPDHNGLGVLSDDGAMLHYAEEPGPSILELSDGTRVFFPHDVTQRGWIIKDVLGVAFAGADPVVRVVTEKFADIILRDVRAHHTWESVMELGE
ncbi:MAG: hypothetical protein R3316_10710, partial [Rhodovibrionaceae bacterium]|nr:hypothetical protein [Rhodovibrionaceae bacterium]